jgi:hypothetical protein
MSEANISQRGNARAAVWQLWCTPSLPALHEQLLAAVAIAAAAVESDDSLSVEDRNRFSAAVLYRLAEAKLLAGDPLAAEQALQLMSSHASDDDPWRFAAGVRACRVALRRGQRDLAQSTLVVAAQQMSEQHALVTLAMSMVGSESHAWRCAVIELGVAIGEVEVGNIDPPEPTAVDAVRALLASPVIDPRCDAVFTMRQLLTAFAFANGDASAASVNLRANVKFAHDMKSADDEIESRLALIGVLTELGEPVHLAEAVRHAQQARDAALAISQRRGDLYMATLVAQAAVLERTGRRAGALDRCIEVAQEASKRGDLAQYVTAVGVMSEMYARGGDIASAFRTLAEANAALSKAVGADTAAKFRPFMQRLVDRVGMARLRQVANDVAMANELLSDL